MKRTISKLLGALGLAICGSLALSSAANAALTVSPYTYGSGTTAITCYARWGGNQWPDNATSAAVSRFIYCGQEIASLPANPTQAQLQAIGLTAVSSLVSMPTHVKTLFTSEDHHVFVFKDFNQRFTPFGLTPPASGANLAATTDTVSAPPVTRLYEQKQSIPFNAYEVAFNAQHEAGHAYQAFKDPAIYLANDPIYRQLVGRDFLYMDLKNPGNTFRGTYQYYLTDYGSLPGPLFGYEELFSEEFSLSPNLPGSVPDSVKAVDPLIRDNFKCSQAYVNAHYQRGANPIKSDFTAMNSAADPDVYSRCVLPYKTAACSYVPDPNKNYPWLASSTTFYVYCGSNPTRFQVRSGDNLMSLPTATPTQWRQKFQYAGYALYVFQDSAQALSILGAAAVPSTATAPGVLGFHQPQPVGNATTPFVAMFERVKQANGSYVEHPNTNDLFNYDQGLYRETGRGIDRIAGSTGSTSSAFRNRITGDISRFNLKNGCASTGPDSTLWGSLKSTICNTTTQVKKPPYDVLTNLQIVKGLTVAQIGSGAVQFPPDYQAMFADVPAAANFSLIWAELVGFKRADVGNDFKGLHIWLTKVYPCGKLYSDGFYTTAVGPTATCP